MSSSFLNVAFDCSESESMAGFWSKVTHWPCASRPCPANPYWLVEAPDGVGPRLVFVDVPEGKTIKNRVHLDLMPRDRSQAEEVARIESLGGQVIEDRRRLEPGGWVVMVVAQVISMPPVLMPASGELVADSL
jgi:hypothetical protein